MKRLYDPTNFDWHPLEEGDAVEYNMGLHRYRINGVEYEGEYFVRNEETIRYVHSSKVAW